MCFKRAKHIIEKYGYKFEIHEPNELRSDESLLDDIINSDLYQLKGQKYDTIIDVGANIGTFSVMMADRADQIYAYEPVSSNFELLNANLVHNGIKNVKTFQRAIMGEKQRAKIWVNEINYASSSIYQKQSNKFEEVEAITLQDIFDDNKIERCNLLKLDCEGAEWEMLMNTHRSLMNKIDLIVAEMHAKDSCYLWTIIPIHD